MPSELNISPTDRDLLAKAKAALNVSDRNVAPWWKFNCAAQPAAIIDLITRLGEAQAALAEMEKRKDAAYEERNRVVSLAARMAKFIGYPVGTAKTAIEGWAEDWHGCVYIDLPNGQVSWHFHDSQANLFVGLPEYHQNWDGHDTAEKYRRVAEAFTEAGWDALAVQAPPDAPASHGKTTIDALDAVTVLNLHKHREHTEWYVGGLGVAQTCGDSCSDLEEFEAIAIAEKYLRAGLAAQAPAAEGRES